MYVRHRTGGYTCTFVTHSLLQCHPGENPESNDNETATSVEHCSSCGQLYSQVQPRLVVTPPYLHWPDVSERVVYKLGIMVFNCLHGQAPPYFAELFQPVTGVASRQHLQSATQQSWSTWWYCITSSAPIADRLSVWLVRQSGIPCRAACRIRLLAGTVSDNL